MAFELKHQSPLKQGIGIDDLKKPVDNKFNKRMQSSLSSSNKKKEVSSRNKTGDGFVSKMSLDNQPGIVKAAVQLADPTGVSSYSDTRKAWTDKKLNYKDVVEPIGAIPLIGKIPKLAKAGLNLVKGVSTATKVNRVTSKVNKASRLANQEKLGEEVMSPLNQKLSPLAAKKKAARDLAYAKTDDRRAKKAHSQRMRRKDPKGKGKDWDHEDGRWESVKQNRGNEGEGTKKESGKRYKVPK